MIKVTMRNIEQLELPLNTTSKILERGTSKEVLQKLEKKYGFKSHIICTKSPQFGYVIYINPEYKRIPETDKNKWVTNYEVYVRSSFKYKFMIWLYKAKTKL